jgi:hypothetical protein
MYLLDKCGSGTELPMPTRAKLLQWVLFANSTLEECVFGPHRWADVPCNPAAGGGELEGVAHLLVKYLDCNDVEGRPAQPAEHTQPAHCPIASDVYQGGQPSSGVMPF